MLRACLSLGTRPLTLALTLVACAPLSPPAPPPAPAPVTVAPSPTSDPEPAARWDFHPEAAYWSRASRAALYDHAAPLVAFVPRDIDAWCPAYPSAEAQDRRSFWVGLILILTFAVNLGWLPAGGRGDTVTVFGIPWSFLTLDGLSHIVLPAINLALFKLAMMIRLARAGTREIMLTDTIKFARAAGISEGVILRRHPLVISKHPVVFFAI